MGLSVFQCNLYHIAIMRYCCICQKCITLTINSVYTKLAIIMAPLNKIICITTHAHCISRTQSTVYLNARQHRNSPNLD